MFLIEKHSNKFPMISKIINLIFNISIYKTLLINYRILGFKKMYRIPILIYKNVHLELSKANVDLMCKPTFGLIRIGLYKENLYSKKNDETKFSIHGKLEIKGRALFYSGSRIIVLNSGCLSLGSDFEIGSNSAIIACKQISIGNNCMISWDTLIMDSDLHPIYDIGNNRINNQRDVVIGKDVWICCRCLIQKGASIPNGSIVPASSIIRRVYEIEKCIISHDRISKKRYCWSRLVMP